MNIKKFTTFERFDANSLNKIFKFLNDNGKNSFISKLKEICEYLDIPMSKLNDDLFQYLSYQSAIKIVNKVDGGNHLQYLKFWFTSTGSFAGITGVDGSKKIDVDQAHLSFDEISKLEEGSELILKPDSWSDDKFYSGKIHISNGKIFFISWDGLSGNYPTGNEWRKYGNRSYEIRNRHDYAMALLPDGFGDKWDGQVILNGSRISIESYFNVPEKANFAIIMDMEKLKSQNIISSKDLKIKRSDNKSGAFKKNDEVKKSNIDRYISKIVDNWEWENLEKIIPRLFGGPYCIFFLYRERNFRDLDEIIYILKNIEGKDSEYRSNELKRLKSFLKERIIVSRQDYLKLESNLKKSQLKLTDDIINLGKKFNQKILSSKISTLRDLEIIKFKMYGFTSFLKKSRYSFGEYPMSDLIYYTENGYINELNNNRSVWENTYKSQCNEFIKNMEYYIDKL